MTENSRSITEYVEHSFPRLKASVETRDNSLLCYEYSRMDFKFETRKPEVRALLEMPDKRLRLKGSRGGSRMNKRSKRQGCRSSKSKKAKLSKTLAESKNQTT